MGGLERMITWDGYRMWWCLRYIGYSLLVPSFERRMHASGLNLNDVVVAIIT